MKIDKIIDNKLISNTTKRYIVNITRSRRGLMDIITVWYPVSEGRIRELSYRIPMFFGWLSQLITEIGFDRIFAH